MNNQPFSQMLRQVQENIYPSNGMPPIDPRWQLYRTDPDSRQQLMMSLMIQMAEQHEKQVLALATHLAKLEATLTQALTPPTEAAISPPSAVPGQPAAPQAAPILPPGEQFEQMPEVRAVNGPMLPVPVPAQPLRSMAQPIPVPAAAGNPFGGQVTTTPFTPAQIPAGTQPPHS